MSTPLTSDERDGIITAAKSVFTKLRNLYREIEPIFVKYGFTAPSAGVVARDLSEKIEVAITQHCNTFSKGVGHCDLLRCGTNWEVKICKGGGLTINQSKVVAGENYIVVNYTADTRVAAVWILWDAQDGFFSAKKPNTNARSILKTTAAVSIEVLFHRPAESKASQQQQPTLPLPALKQAKAALERNATHKAS